MQRVAAGAEGVSSSQRRGNCHSGGGITLRCCCSQRLSSNRHGFHGLYTRIRGDSASCNTSCNTGALKCCVPVSLRCSALELLVGAVCAAGSVT